MKRNTVIMITVAGTFFLLGTLFNIASSWIGNRPIPLLNGYTSTGYISRPAYDSGWINRTQTTTIFTHDLNVTEVFVYVIGKDLDGNLKIHQYGNYAFWTKLDSSNLSVYCNAPSWDQIRVMIWKIP